MTALDFINKIYELGVSKLDMEKYLEAENISLRDFLNKYDTFTVDELAKFLPLDIYDLHLDIDKMEQLFKA